jgi:SAM-dependent methyltransferase
MPRDIDHARRLCANAEIDNLTLHEIDFAAASEIDMIDFDYIVAHGVYSWIAPRFREDMCRFIDRRLKPGGLVYISYNSLPGWASDAPFQFLLR